MAALPVLLVFFPQMTYTMEQSALYRNPTGDFSIANFRRYSFHYLWVEKISWSMVEDQIDCTFLCVAEPKCYSFNMAAYPDFKDLYLCELLATDKYRETQKFHPNATFHHLSPLVRYCQTCISPYVLFPSRTAGGPVSLLPARQIEQNTDTQTVF